MSHMEEDVEAKVRAEARARASIPGAQAVSAEEAEKPRKSKKTKKRSDGSERSFAVVDAAPDVTVKRSSRSRRVSEATPGAYSQTTELEGESAEAGNSRGDASKRSSARAVVPGAQAVVPGAHAQMIDLEARVSAKVRAEASSIHSSKPGASHTDQMGDLEARIAAKTRSGETRSSTSKPGVSSQLDDLEAKIAAKSRCESKGSRTSIPGTMEQLDDLESKIAAKSQRDSRGTRPELGPKEQLDDMESRIAAKSRREARGSRSSVSKSGANAQLEDLESRIASKAGRSSARDPATAKLDDAHIHDAENPADDVIHDFMDSFADYGNVKFDDDFDKDNGDQSLNIAAQGILSEPDYVYDEYSQAHDDGLAVAVAVEDDEEDAFIPAAIEYDPDAKPPIYKNRRFRLYSMLSCILVIVVIVAVSVVETSKKRQQNNGPTSAPTSFRETLGIQKQFISVVGAEKMNDPESPQARAADWMMNDDPMLLMPESYNLIQRYLLAVFYFSSTEKGPWVSCNPPTGSENSTCVYRELLEVDPELTYGNKTWVRWLSGESECTWAGVFCDENDYIAALELSGQGMTGTLPEELSQLIYLQSITLDWNFFSGPLPVTWATNKHLLNIEAHYNFLTGTIPSEWFSAKALQRINVGGNMLTGTVSTDIGNLDALKGFFNMENMMSGTIPTEFAGLKFVSYTRWSTNEHTGTIPPQFGAMSKLQEMWLHKNFLKGTIPSELGDMRELLDIRLHFQSLTGTIPEEIYNIGSLTRLDVYDCKLTGTISTNISKASSLEVFRIRANEGITGTVPSEIALLPNINEVWLQLTGLVGTMPDEVCAIRGVGNLESLSANCADTNGFKPAALVCQCCTECCDAATKVCTPVDGV